LPAIQRPGLSRRVLLFALIGKRWKFALVDDRDDRLGFRHFNRPQHAGLSVLLGDRELGQFPMRAFSSVGASLFFPDSMRAFSDPIFDILLVHVLHLVARLLNGQWQGEGLVPAPTGIGSDPRKDRSRLDCRGR
jgi:hypothetical protein